MQVHHNLQGLQLQDKGGMRMTSCVIHDNELGDITVHEDSKTRLFKGKLQNTPAAENYGLGPDNLDKEA